GLSPMTCASASLGVIGCMNAALGFRPELFFARFAMSSPLLMLPGTPPPLARARRRAFAALPAGASRWPQALFNAPGDPTPARSRSAARLRRASRWRLALAAGASLAHTSVKATITKGLFFEEWP